MPDRLGSPSTSVVLGGRAFIAYYGEGRLRMIDVTEPLRPRMALDATDEGAGRLGLFDHLASPRAATWSAAATTTCGSRSCLSRDWSPENNPLFDFAHPQTLGPEKDPQPAGHEVHRRAGRRPA